jgi:nicotinate-nucleotide adenylyltransferase
MRKIALFGTSADPPTIGHQTVLDWLSQHYDRVIVWASDNPFKDHQTTLNDRTEMLNLAIAEINSDKRNISLRPDLSDRHTLVTVNKAREIWGENIEYTLVIGSDILQQITNWYRIEELLKQVKILIVPRPGYLITEQDLNSLINMGGRCAIATLNAPKVSSSTYRFQKDKTLITSAVDNYILQKHLYSSDTDTNKYKSEEKI